MVNIHHRGKVSPKSEKVKEVTFKSRYGIALTGDLYLPKGVSCGLKGAVAISGPLGAAKERAYGSLCVHVS